MRFSTEVFLCSKLFSSYDGIQTNGNDTVWRAQNCFSHHHICFKIRHNLFIEVILLKIFSKTKSYVSLEIISALFS